ncbi:hypothetical protein [Streptomyces poonensis]|uniref:Uncharacterized protein n=1 Tax=Streptomyces poonensis TaxID=68255 RepID=A0A918UE63_9ACTN|nr:hypothetical protein [Streptomyces poonensis]GGY99373.1 hypothetical protein GCM10010365_17570 [Streptomyces poonensis]
MTEPTTPPHDGPRAPHAEDTGAALDALARQVADLRTATGPANVAAAGATNAAKSPVDRTVAVVGEARRGRTTVAGYLASLAANGTTKPGGPPGVRVLDAPPWDAPDAVPDADLVVVTVSAASPVGSQERRLLEAVPVRTGGATVIVAVTRLDTVDDAERPEVMRYIEQRVHTCLPGVRVVAVGQRPEEAAALCALVASSLRGTTEAARSRRRLRVRLAADLTALGERAAREAGTQAEERALRAARDAALRKDLTDGEEAWVRLTEDLNRLTDEQTATTRKYARGRQQDLHRELLRLHREKAPETGFGQVLAELWQQAAERVDREAAGDRAELERRIRHRFGDTVEKPDPVPGPAPPGTGPLAAGRGPRLDPSTLVVAIGAGVITAKKAQEAKWNQAAVTACIALAVFAQECRTQTRNAAEQVRERSEELAAALEETTAEYTRGVYRSLNVAVTAAHHRWRHRQPSPRSSAEPEEKPDWAAVRDRVTVLQGRLRELVAQEYEAHDHEGRH